jgi:hypothetical protein
MYSLIYLSSAIEKFTKEGLDELLTISRERNIEHNITGLLILKDYMIVQYIEGEEKEVKQLFENIKKDSRHFNVNLLHEEIITKRLFHNWSMGIKNYDELEGVELEYTKNFDFEDLDNLPQLFQKFITQM